jgi:hypothetical protein
MQIQNRIKEYRQVKASELLPNPKNWRTHPTAQADAMRGVLAEIGYADALIVYETPNGLMLIDGHLRAETTPDMEVPVLVTDLSSDEADKLLATLDPLAAAATVDSQALSELLDGLSFQNEDVMDMLKSISDESLTDITRLMLPPDDFESYDEDIPTDYTCPSCHYEWSGKPK